MQLRIDNAEMTTLAEEAFELHQKGMLWTNAPTLPTAAAPKEEFDVFGEEENQQDPQTTPTEPDEGLEMPVVEPPQADPDDPDAAPAEAVPRTLPPHGLSKWMALRLVYGRRT